MLSAAADTDDRTAEVDHGRELPQATHGAADVGSAGRSLVHGTAHEKAEERQLRPLAANERLARLTHRQYGVFTAAQARQVGIGADALALLRRRGVVVRRARGIYAFHAVPDSSHARWLVAQLRHGPSAVLSHRTAGAVHELQHGLRLDAVHLTVPGRSGHERAGCILHRGVLVEELEVVRRGPFRVTSVARNLCELAGEIGDREVLRSLVAAAVRQGLVEVAGVRGVLGLRGRFPGRTDLRRVLDELSPLEAMTRGVLESRFLHLATAAGMAPSAMNHAIIDDHGRRRFLDAVWLPQGVYAELDSRRFHGTLVDWHDDQRRENAIALAGFVTCLRFSWWDITEHADLVVDTLRRALGR